MSTTNGNGNQELVTIFSFRANLERLETITRRINQSFTRITMSSTSFRSSLNGINREFNSIGRTATSIALSITGLLYSIGKMSSAIANPIIDLDNLARSTNSSAAAIFTLSNGLRSIGVNKNEISALLEYSKKIRQSIALGGWIDSSTNTSMQRLGMRIEQFEGKDVSEISVLLMKTILEKFPTEALRANFYSQMGVGTGELGLLVKEKHLESLTKIAEGLEGSLEASAEASRVFKEALGELSVAFTELGVALAPSLKIVAAFLDTITGVVKFLTPSTDKYNWQEELSKGIADHLHPFDRLKNTQKDQNNGPPVDENGIPLSAGWLLNGSNAGGEVTNNVSMTINTTPEAATAIALGLPNSALNDDILNANAQNSLQYYS